MRNVVTSICQMSLVLQRPVYRRAWWIGPGLGGDFLNQSVDGLTRITHDSLVCTGRIIPDMTALTI